MGGRGVVSCSGLGEGGRGFWCPEDELGRVFLNDSYL